MGRGTVKVTASGAPASPVLSPGWATAAPALRRQAFLGLSGVAFQAVAEMEAQKSTDLVRGAQGSPALEGDATQRRPRLLALKARAIAPGLCSGRGWRPRRTS